MKRLKYSVNNIYREYIYRGRPIGLILNKINVRRKKSTLDLFPFLSYQREREGERERERERERENSRAVIPVYM